MASFKTRINKIAKKNGPIILANDYDFGTKNLEAKTIKNIEKLHSYICAIKINFHLLLPLGSKEITKIIKTAHKYGLQTIADIKLNDIGNTNQVTLDNLWKFGFDAVIVNPIMGKDSLKKLISNAHKNEKGVITLCHMSAPEARLSYELEIKHNKKQSQLYKLFLDWAITQKADGIIAGATFPDIIKFCKNKIKNKLDIYSPGIGTQGGSVSKVLSAGTNFLIVGRTIINSKNPKETAKTIQLESFGK